MRKTKFECTRRGALKATAALGLTCGTAQKATGTRTEPVSSNENQKITQEWEVLKVSNYPFDVRYRSGYQDDAKKVKDWAVYAHGVIQDLYPFEIETPFTFDVYPASEYTRQHGTMTYLENVPAVELVTPSEYEGSYANKDLYFRHGVVHEYVHAVQKDNLPFHTHANWYMEGLAEAVAVYHTNQEILKSYHQNHRRSQEAQSDIERGYGHVLGVNEYVYRGSMHFMHFMMRQYGSEAVFELTEQNANSIIEAIDMRLGQTPLDLEANWLKYAQVMYGGDYIDEIHRLGDSVPAFLELASPPYEKNTVTVNRAVYDEADYKIVVYDQDKKPVDTSDTYSAGEWAEDFQASFDQQLKNPTPFSVQLHEATSSGYGDVLKVYGEALKRERLYATSQSAIRFAEAMHAGDTSVYLHVHIGSGVDGRKFFVQVHAEDERRIHDGHHRFSKGINLIGIEIPLDTQNNSVPLSKGQKITVEVVKDAGDETMAKQTQEVLANSSNQESYTATPIEATATATATATAVTTQTEPSESTATELSPSESTKSKSDATESVETVGGEESVTTASTPGFGIEAALSAIAGGIALFKWRENTEN